MEDKMGENGVIGKSGKFYKCNFYEHIQTCIQYSDDAPFILLKSGDYIEALMPANRKQFEKTIEWCLEMEVKFEDITIGWAWNEWKQE